MNYLLCFLFFLLSSTINAESFDHWKIKLSKTLQKSKINKSTIDQFIKHAKFNQKVIDLYNQQLQPVPTPLLQFLNTWFQSEDISKSFISIEGKKLIKENISILKKVEKKYGVEKSVIVALWGIESKYGKLMGKYPVLDSLSTLAYKSKRSDFYKNELINALKIIQKNKIGPEQFLGSSAGAIGQCQFMPSNYFIYGVDFDKNNKVDLFNSKSDIFASIANYLKKNKWQYGRPVGQLVRVPANFDPKTLNQKSKNNLYWNKKNIRNPQSQKLPAIKDKSRIISLTMEDINYLVIYKNFDVILRWNRSNLFGLKTLLLKETFEM